MTAINTQVNLSNQNLNSYEQNSQINLKPSELEKQNEGLEEHLTKSAIEVSISMNAQIVLFAMDTSQLNKDNMSAQKEAMAFLSGNQVEGQISLKDLGYEGKPITELSVKEAKALLENDGFFGIEQTASRVAQFVFSFSGDDPAIMQKGLEGVVKGFEEANELWGGKLPEISHETQARTLELIEKRIAELTTSVEPIEQESE